MLFCQRTRERETASFSAFLALSAFLLDEHLLEFVKSPRETETPNARAKRRMIASIGNAPRISK
jgi:hypothetical protein